MIQRANLMDETLRKAGLDASIGDEADVMSLQDAIRLIQRHERSRQGRAKFTMRKQMIARQV